MTKPEVFAALHVEFARWCAETGVQPEQMSDVDRMIFQSAFIAGAEWMVKHVRERATT